MIVSSQLQQGLPTGDRSRKPSASRRLESWSNRDVSKGVTTVSVRPYFNAKFNALFQCKKKKKKRKKKVQKVLPHETPELQDLLSRLN